MKKRVLPIILALLLLLAPLLAGCDVLERVLADPDVQSALIEAIADAAGETPTATPRTTAAPGASQEATPEPAELDEHGAYTTKDDVALFLITYGRLPDNFITKAEANKLGWQGGGLDRYAKGKCIGGDRFGNREGLLPKASGRTYTECDIDTLGASSRGAKRIVFSNDGLIYYTDDHYASFTLLYGEE